MKTNWQTKKLSEICDLQNGFAFKSKDYVSKSETLNFRMSNIRPGGFVDIYHNQKFLPDQYAIKYKDYLLKDGDLVIAMTDMATETKILGVPTIVKTEGKILLLNQRVGKFFNIQEDKVYIPFLKYILSSEQVNNYYKSLGRGGMQINIGKQDILNAKIPLPTLSEQKRIVKILDNVFNKIEKAKINAEKNLQNSKALFESYLQNVFANLVKNYKEKRLGDVCDTGAGGTPLKSHKDYYENGTIPWLRSGEVDKKDIVECVIYITEKGLKNSSARLFPVNTVLIAMYGATAGQVGILRFKCSTNQAICGILPNKNFIPEFLYYKFLAGKDILVKQAVGGAQPNISQIKIKNTSVPVITIEEQKVIVKKLDALSEQTKKLESIYKQKLTDLEELKKSVLRRAFSGDL